MLFRAFNRRDLIAFVGAGLSAPLGYPTWGPLVARVLSAAETSRTRPGTGADFDPKPWVRRLAAGERLSADELTWLMARARDVLSGEDATNAEFHAVVARECLPREPRVPPAHNPHDALADLPINRFITTNYDHEIERALSRRRDIPFERFGIGEDAAKAGPDPLSFTQHRDSAHLLAVIALTKGDPEAVRVFHCHGRVDRRDTIVATEAEYQHWYLHEGLPEVIAYVQTLRLLLTSSPILFIGYGLGDEDLLRPLRMLSEAERGRKASRPLFALTPATDGDASREGWLFERFGVRLLRYPAPPVGHPDHAGALTRYLRELKEEWPAWREGLQAKPLLRTVVVNARPRETFWHYYPQRDRSRRGDVLASERIDRTVDELCEAALGPARIIGFVGLGGTGKSWHAIELLNRLAERGRGFDSFFFWSSYYTNDRITGLDRLLGYVDPKGNRSHSRLERLAVALKRQRHLVVFDGFERLLESTDVPGDGRPAVPGVAEFINLFLAEGCRSTLVLTTRLWPDLLRKRHVAEEHAAIREEQIKRMVPSDLEGVEPLRFLEKKGRSELCSLLDGHAYGLALATWILEEAPDSARTFVELRRALSAVSLNDRLDKIIEQAIRRVELQHGSLARGLLERIALFMGPVTDPILEICGEAARSSEGEANAKLPRDWWHSVRKVLLRSRLVLQLEAGPCEGRPVAYTVHPTVRSYVFEHSHQIAASDTHLPTFHLTGYTSGNAPVHPGSREGCLLVRDIYDRLVAAIGLARAEGNDRTARDLFRGLFGVVRSRMEANTAVRWAESYDDYLRLTMHVANLAKELAPDVWNQCDGHNPEIIEHAEGPLYADELAWLYNDIGLALCAEGDFLDTHFLWAEGFEINRVMEAGTRFPQNTLQSQLHMAHVYIDLGRLDKASQYLQDCEETNHRLGDDDYTARIFGYRALVAHLGGDLEGADTLYSECEDRLARRRPRNSRAEPHFRLHHAALKIRRGDHRDAATLIETSEALAHAGMHPDLIARVRLTRGTLLRHQKRYALATKEFGKCREWSNAKGCHRLECEALSELSRLALDLGDGTIARQRAVGALKIANECGMGLRQTHGLLVLGLASIASDLRDLGVAYLRHALARARRQQYLLIANEIERRLDKQGASHGISDA